uniref:Uncharacterized protein n=1 Tax=Anguilla anguilla TaxID=7936 RepID=A0A0E9QAG9_ANGAN
MTTHLNEWCSNKRLNLESRYIISLTADFLTLLSIENCTVYNLIVLFFLSDPL